jgi:NAD(P)-dependent dehydrogenase (short-subunit alcohol dehydrogenase family)
MTVITFWWVCGTGGQRSAQKEGSMHIVVTGANRGIGLEFCKQAQERGHQVTALCRKSSDDLAAIGVNVVEGVDVRNPPELSELGDIDWAILNAGIWRNETLDNLDFESMTEQFEINTLGPLRVFDKLSASLKHGSKIALITSAVGSMTNNTTGGRYGYRASKAALNSVGVSLAHDLKSRGVAVGLFHPGYVATDMTQYKGSISPTTSVQGLFNVIEALNLENTGTFWDYRGQILPW